MKDDQLNEKHSLVSIVIPVYNGANFIKEAIDSALNQTYKNIEIIVVNDGSNDNGETESILSSYGSEILCIHKDNGGVASALNTGIANMKGDYFSWLSHDDVYSDDKVEAQICLLSKETSNVILYSGYSVINENSEVLYYILKNSINPKKFILHLLCFSGVSGCTTLIPKDCFDKVGLFNESLLHVQDIDFWIRASRFYNFQYVNKVLVKTRLHSMQTSNIASVEQKDEKELFFIDVLSKDILLNNNIFNYYSTVFWTAKRLGYNRVLKYLSECRKVSKKHFGYLNNIFFDVGMSIMLVVNFVLLVIKYLKFNGYKKIHMIIKK